MSTKSYFVIQKKIKDIWEDWIEFNETNTLSEVVDIYNTKNKEQHQLIKRTDKVLHID